VSFTLAHLSDVHLANMRKLFLLRNFSGKRIIGGFSWFLRRRHVHFNAVADAIQASIIASAPDHVALTGDLVNVAAWNEFPEAANWVARFGNPDALTFVPGNHDAYVPVPWARGLANLEPWMKPDRYETTGDNSLFPFVRLRRTVALIGLNSGLPQKYHLAAGTVGAQQLRDLGHVLSLLGQQGFYRVVLIHHPPLPGLAVARKALTDAAALKAVLAESGCELVLHGHNHRGMLNWLDTKNGMCPVIGAPSASINGDDKHETAGWNQYRIKRHQGQWQTEMTPHRWDRKTQAVEQQSTVMLLPP
jgi:3',5'-cyclic AMP phosphodiesterase CpdA